MKSFVCVVVALVLALVARGAPHALMGARIDAPQGGASPASSR